MKQVTRFALNGSAWSIIFRTTPYLQTGLSDTQGHFNVRLALYLVWIKVRPSRALCRTSPWVS